MSFFKRHTQRLDLDTDEENEENIDPELRLRTVRTAASAIAESIRSEQRAQRRKTTLKKNRSRFFRRHTHQPEKKVEDGVEVEVEMVTPPPVPSASTTTTSKEVPGLRRNVYVNYPLSAMEVDQNGEPKTRHVRNKVRTTKYTILTFIPKNLYEQFRRVANLFFLSLVILQLFPIFGAAAGSIAVLPLAFILTVTAIKDGIEDYRRGVLDEEVNTSAATKLGGGWKNVNQPIDPRSWLEKLLGINPPGKVTKGVRKLRERETGIAGQELRVVLKQGEDDASVIEDMGQTSLDNGARSFGFGAGRKLEDIRSIDSHSYPPATLGENSKVSLSDSATVKESNEYGQSGHGQYPNIGSLSQYQQSIHSRSSVGVVDWRKHSGGSARWERTLWKKLEVGDVVLLRDNDQVPADIVVLSTSDPDGMCYLETKNLDGETNLKPRKAVKATSSITSEEDIEKSSFYLDSEPPHQNLYLYRGVLRYNDPNGGETKQEPVTINELLLRGCALRNTSWVIGLVVFTGSDTKIMLNGGDTPSKRSKIEKETNFNVIVNFCLLTVMCLIAAIFSGVQDAREATSAQYFEEGSDPTNSYVVNAIITFVSCLIAFQNIVPISLYISIEIVKTIQAYFISQDIDMYYEPYDTPCVPKTWNISDDLGQIEYVFSDKTGTLTQNVMEFQKCSIHGVKYGEGITEAQRGAATRQGKGDTMDPKEINEKLEVLKGQMIGIMERTFKNRWLQSDKVTLVAPKLAEDLAGKDNSNGKEGGNQRSHAIAFFKALALCHTVLADKPEPREQPFLLNYKAESPDEAALVSAARDAGFPFIGKMKESLEIEVMGQVERYTLLKVLEFNSTRKRMSVVVRTPEGKLVLYTKGADSVIYERLEEGHDQFVKEQTSKDMEEFANGGLRTLCIAYRDLEEEEYLNWGRVYDNAASATENREEEIDKANELIERDLKILGATALEDKLQEGVPEAIEMLHRAGIKLWILTGDKLQTAIEIGYSCNLLKNDMDVMILSADNLEQTRQQIEAGLNKIASILGPPSWEPSKRGFVPGLSKASFAVVIDGDTLRHALTPELKPLFLNLGTQCETVVCCRVSPAQKALTVKLVKEGRNAMTLSIGDGANDVAMIQEANIGCGLFGLEGSQAAMSADYAFGQFRFLTKLLLVHGRWSYQRVADMHSNFFYKNVIWTFGMFWFLPFNSFDATYLYQYTFILLYNLVFTSLPVIVLGAFDQDINSQAALAFPQLYVRGIRGLEYTRTKFWLYMSDGLYQSAVVFFIPYLVWSLGNPITWNGRGIDSLADFGTTVAVAAILSANTYVGINTHYWTVMTWVVVVGSTLVMLLWILIFSFFFSSDFIDEVLILFGGITFWATALLSAGIALAPRFIVKFISTVYYPLDKDIVREMWVMGDLKDRLGIKHRKEKKNKKKLQQSNLEAAPMFHEQHSRSTSELSVHNDAYEPTVATTPLASPKPGYSNELEGGHGHGQYDQFLNTPQPAHSSSTTLTNVEQGSLGFPMSDYQQQQQQYLSPTDLHRRSTHGENTLSPSPSYYSISDIPPPSPVPPTKYRLPSGEITTTPPPPNPMNRLSSASTIRGGNNGGFRSPEPLPRLGFVAASTAAAANSSPSKSLSGHNNMLLQPHSPTSTIGGGGGSSGIMRRLSGNGGRKGGANVAPPNTYEMRVRSPQVDEEDLSGYGHTHGGRSASSAVSHNSYATADEFWEDELGDERVQYTHVRGVGARGGNVQRDEDEDEDDRRTIVGVAIGNTNDVGHDRQPSEVSWTGGRAL